MVRHLDPELVMSQLDSVRQASAPSLILCAAARSRCLGAEDVPWWCGDDVQIDGQLHMSAAGLLLALLWS